jgi:hypothetical protein
MYVAEGIHIRWAFGVLSFTLARDQLLLANCGSCSQVLLQTQEQTAGLTIMEGMAAQQETSFERLYRWTRMTCRSLTQATPDHPTILVAALRALRNRSVLFEFCFGELSNARHNAVVRGFIDALTRGGPGGLPKPIELHSHDPVRYVLV